MPSADEPDTGDPSRLLADLAAFLDEHRYCGENAELDLLRVASLN
jgi:hypothetical protein